MLEVTVGYLVGGQIVGQCLEPVSQTVDGEPVGVVVVKPGGQGDGLGPFHLQDRIAIPPDADGVGQILESQIPRLREFGRVQLRESGADGLVTAFLVRNVAGEAFDRVPLA